MSKRRRVVLDTSVLVTHWRRCGGARVDVLSNADGDEWAHQLIEMYDTDMILSPVYIEFICGTKNQREYQTACDFLSVFQVLDGWNILPVDIQEARRVAQRIPRDGLPRQFGDCLIRAMAKRFGARVETLESRFPT